MEQAKGWHAARLIPASGIDGAAEQEHRATSALLSVMGAVPAFARALTEPLGAPSGPVETYVDVPLTLDGEPFVAAGVVRIHHAPDTWTALVQVRTGGFAVRPEHLADCLDVAAQHGFDAVVTVGGEPPAEPPPGAVPVRHLAWGRVAGEAVRQRDTTADPARAWILRELVRYLDDEAAGVAAELDDEPVIEKAPATPPVPAETRITDLTRGPRVVDLTKLAAETSQGVEAPEPAVPAEPPAAVVPEPVEAPPAPEPVRPMRPVARIEPVPPPPPSPVIATPVRMVLRELLAASDGAPPTAETPKITLPAGTEGAPPAAAPPAVPPPAPTTPARPVTAAVRDLVREPVRSPVTGPTGTPVIPDPALAAPADGMGAAAETAVIPMPDPALVPDRGPSRREIRLARTLDELTDHDAGWYLDPGDDGVLRWWSGSAWGAATYPVQRVDTPTPTRGRTHDAALSTPS